MGNISPSKMPSAKRKARRDDTDFTQYKEGGEVGLAERVKRFKTKLKQRKYSL